MNDPIAAAKERLAVIEEEAEKLRTFIAAWESVADFLDVKIEPIPAKTLVVDKSLEEAEESPSKRTRAVNPPSRDIIDAALAALAEYGHPLTRRALHQELWKRGTEVHGADPVKTLGTILWRAQNEIIQLEGYGYWPKGMPYERAHYYPAQHPKPDLDGLLG